jgi:hypothetical protein
MLVLKVSKVIREISDHKGQEEKREPLDLKVILEKKVI